MPNFSTSSTVQQIRYVSDRYQFYSSIVIMVGGLISNIFLLIILIRLRIFRGNQCAFYLIVECLANISLLLVIFPSRILTYILGEDPSQLSIVWCRIRSWATQVSCLISLFTICFATFDQFLSTNYRYTFRKMSTLRLAYRLTIANIIFSVLHNIPLLILSDIRSVTGCSVYNSILRKYFTYFYYPFLISSIPLIVTSFFSLLAYRNVRRIVRRQTSIVRHQLDRQLTAMILARVICLFILGLPYTIYSLYALNSSIKPNDYNSLAVRRLIEAITLSLFYANYSVNFYVFLAISSRFRHQVKHFVIRKCCRRSRPPQVVPKNDHQAISVIELSKTNRTI